MPLDKETLNQHLKSFFATSKFPPHTNPPPRIPKQKSDKESIPDPRKAFLKAFDRLNYQLMK